MKAIHLAVRSQKNLYDLYTVTHRGWYSVWFGFVSFVVCQCSPHRHSHSVN